MILKLDTKDLQALVRGSVPNHSAWDYELVKKAGHVYNDYGGRTSWSSLDKLTDEELGKLYFICKNSWL